MCIGNYGIKEKICGKHKSVILSITEKLVKKIELGVFVACVCEDYGVKKQTVSDISKFKDKLKLCFEI